MTWHITITGMVQGVGFRPYVLQLARTLGLTGTVQNSGGIVQITACGQPQALKELACRLQDSPPPGAQVLRVCVQPSDERELFSDFSIIPSSNSAAELPILPPDLPPCEDCLSELSDPASRRYRYPFISCASCGPRYSIMDHIPYDREHTSMADFSMCSDCAREYSGNDRRRHAQTISCHSCGPQLLLQLDRTTYQKEQALQTAVERLTSGDILMVKGTGGYQYICLPTSEQAATRLRLLKGREQKPFAVLFPSMDALLAHCTPTPEEAALLTSSARPIVLLEAAQDFFCPQVRCGSQSLGAFLPPTPLHQLLAEACGPLIVTSANPSGQPMVTQDRQALDIQSPHLAGVLYHTRRIVVPLDDAVARVICGAPQLIRRSRGYVPLPVMLKTSSPVPILAMGGDLKAAFCLAADDRAYLSSDFGDMESAEAMENYQQELTRMQHLLRIQPAYAVCDRHPGYHTHRLAHRQGLPVLQVQHHHAHIASVMAEHQLYACIGVAFDGTGYGEDGTVWGGEFLLCRGADYQRAGYLEPLKLCGGDSAMKDAGLTALCHRHAAGLSATDSRFPTVCAALEQQIQTHQSSSMGRLFDAVCALLGLGGQNGYQGQCAAALETAAVKAKAAGIAPYPLTIPVTRKGGCWQLGRIGLIQDIAAACETGINPGALALGFHLALAQAVVDACAAIREQTGEATVALSGGVFANRLLTEACTAGLEQQGFAVYLNRQVPPSDGGLALGQAWLAAKILEKNQNGGEPDVCCNAGDCC